MKTLAMILEYDGSAFAGWQVQPNAQTVQGCLEIALERICRYKLNVVGAGRTDSGVHAAGQIAHVRLKNKFPVTENKIKKALNANLPKQIRIKKAVLTDMAFHARFDACAREYAYQMVTEESVFETHFAAYYQYPADFSELNEAASVFLGKHDFTSFSKKNPDTPNYVCDVEICRWKKVSQHKFVLQIKADRFVYGMVRCLVGAMWDCIRGRRSPEELRIALAEKDRSLSSPLAPANGLTLKEVFYPVEKFPFA